MDRGPEKNDQVTFRSTGSKLTAAPSSDRTPLIAWETELYTGFVNHCTFIPADMEIIRSRVQSNAGGPQLRHREWAEISEYRPHRIDSRKMAEFFLLLYCLVQTVKTRSSGSRFYSRYTRDLARGVINHLRFGRSSQRYHSVIPDLEQFLWS